ncbi:MAG: ComEA family DNA-binding protein [bacterium]
MYRGKGMKGVVSVFCCTVAVCMVVSLITVMPRAAYARSGEKVAAQEMININTATQDELLLLKRVGPSLADRIIAYREAHGLFQKTEDILNVKGLGEKFWEANKDRITVGKFRAKVE